MITNNYIMAIEFKSVSYFSIASGTSVYFDFQDMYTPDC